MGALSGRPSPQPRFQTLSGLPRDGRPGPLFMPESNESTCSEQERLFAELTSALKNVVEIQSSQIAAVQLGDGKVSEFDE